MDYIPLDDEDLYREIALGDVEALEKINQDTPIPQSNLEPGGLGGQIPGITGFYEPKGSELAMIFRTIHFGYNRHTINGQDNLARIDRIVDYMQRHPNLYLFIEGHCDERGAAAYNLALGSRRSNSVRALLVKQGVDYNRVFTVSYGKERPLANGKGEAAWKQNRRAQFKIHEKSYQ
jgi:peptidoglycan-associated lipoprotein